MKKEKSLGYIYNLANTSKRMLSSTLFGNTREKYALRFKGKLGEKPRYTGHLLAVGISYDKNTKEHSSKIEVL